MTVTTPGGTSATSSADHFTYIAPPTVTAVSPTPGPLAGGTSVTITGTNLSGQTAVDFGATAGTVTADSATSITVDAPAESAGTVDVTVTTAGGTSATSSGDHFTYDAAPTVTGVSPTSGPAAGGTSVTITGTNLADATAVKFGTTTGPSPRDHSDVHHRDFAGRARERSTSRSPQLVAPRLRPVLTTSSTFRRQRSQPSARPLVRPLGAPASRSQAPT